MEGIIGLIACFMCAFPFFIIGHYNKDNSREPIPFWSGDKTLKSKIKDIKGYNAEMSKLYINCSLAFVITGVVCMVCFWAGIILLLLECTAGIYIV